MSIIFLVMINDNIAYRNCFLISRSYQALLIVVIDFTIIVVLLF